MLEGGEVGVGSVDVIRYEAVGRGGFGGGGGRGIVGFVVTLGVVVGLGLHCVGIHEGNDLVVPGVEGSLVGCWDDWEVIVLVRGSCAVRF